MPGKLVNYTSGDINCRGYIVKPTEISKSTPAIVVAHTWRGLDDFCRQKAAALAQLGYIGFAADLFGNGLTASNDDEAFKLMLPLFMNRHLLRERIISALDAVKKEAHADPSRLGAIGFCFGGLAVIELVRSGADISGAVSFHGVLGSSLGGHTADTLPISKTVPGSLLILHGNEDPLVTMADISALQNELTQSGVDWQMNIYGHAAHAFTNPKAKDVKSGLVFNEEANRRSWQAMVTFFNDIFI